MTRTAPAFRDIYFTARDGLRLYGRHYPAAFHDGVVRRPVLCLAGLTRNCRDFNVIAEELSQRHDGPRDVYTFDYRGRGLSEADPDWRNYAVPIEALDVLDFMIVTGVRTASVIGTSRGGLIAMAIAAIQPRALGAVVLNDIGPVIEPGGLMRIKSYVGKLPEPRSFDEGADILRRLFSGQFPRLAAADWLQAAHKTWRQADGRLALTYDARLRETLKAVDPEQPPPAMWNQFDALAGVPVMAIRGVHSDILSAQTLQAMKARRHDLQTVEVADEGHPPLLRGDLLLPISDFVRRCGNRI